MANTPKKVKDPTEVALSAIQEALNISDASASETSRPAHVEVTAPMPSTSAFPAPSFDALTSVDRPAFEPLEEIRQTRRPANDDRETIGQLLQAIQKGRPTRAARMFAIAASAVWIVGGLIIALSFRSSLAATLGLGVGGVLTVAGLLALLLAPALMFFYMANLSSSGRELQMIAQSLAQVAMRFSEPENAASDSMVTVGQAIRREVAAMGDGVERAIARAGELETLVANEVAALERAYSDNEVRIRS